MRLPTLGFLFGAFVAGAATAAAAPAEVDGFHPTIGAPGDLVYLQGRDLGPAARVAFGAQVADVVRATDEVLVCRVPEGLGERSVRLAVGGWGLRERFLVVANGRPVIHGVSASAATAGQTILVHGRRLGGGVGEFIDMEGAVAGSTPVIGGRRVVAIRVPVDVVPGPYRLRITNGTGLSTSWSSPSIQICACDRRRVFTARRSRVCPGQRATFTGTDLGPPGTCEVQWLHSDGGVCRALGWSNGYDRITVIVPHTLRVNQWHQLALAPPGGHARGVNRVFAEEAAVPFRLEIDAPVAAPRATLGIQGMSPCGLGDAPTVFLTRGAFQLPARVLYLHPGGLGHGRSWVVRLPDGCEEGDHTVSVRVGGSILNAGTLRIGERDDPAPDLVSKLRDDGD